MAEAAAKGYAEARCTHTVPSTALARVSGPAQPICPRCLGIVGQELVAAGGDPGRMGRAL